MGISLIKDPSSSYSLYESCQHRQIEQKVAILYCTFLALAYVGALYVLVPIKIRKLHRDDHRQIQFRSMTSVFVCLVALGTYPYLFCQRQLAEEQDDDQKSSTTAATFSLQHILFQTTFLPSVWAHTMTLYVGPIMASLLRVHLVRIHDISLGKTVGNYPSELFRQLLLPDLHSFLTPDSKDEFWKNMRNFIVAPWTEEVVFRACMVPPLLASGMTVHQVTLVAPLFFGIAHIHHAVTRLSQGERLSSVFFITLFQFLYTSLFGSYAAYAFIRTGSVLAVTVSHVYCNWMGLPDLSFVQIRHPMYQFRIVLLASYLIGVFAFKWYLKSDQLLPLPSELPQMITMVKNITAAA
jgi:prenyl protein peptidase